MAIVGPGSIPEEQLIPSPTLDGASEYEYVTILNPLTDDFAIKVAQSVPVNMPFDIRGKTASVQSESDVTRTLGFPLKNPDHQARKHISNTTIIKAGQTVNLKGNEAQVAVRQLVNEIIQREKKTQFLADPTVRRDIENRIIQSRGSIQQLMDNRLQTPQAQADQAIKQSNEVSNEPFPGLNEPTEDTPDSGRSSADTTESSTKRATTAAKKA